MDKKNSFSLHFLYHVTVCLQMPDHFDQTLVLNQLRYSGMLETVRIRRSGFPVRRPFQDFCSRSVAVTTLVQLDLLPPPPPSPLTIHLSRLLLLHQVQSAAAE